MPLTSDSVDDFVTITHSETALNDDDLAKIRDWLQPTDYLADSGEYRRHLSSQAPGTGLWICETDEYRTWHDSPDHSSLWIKGAPGAGKSVTAASIIQHLKATEDCPVLFFFFRNIVAANFSPRALLKDWLAQLLPYSVRLQHALQPCLDTDAEQTSDSRLLELFLDGISNLPKVYCLADALDEMTAENRSFLESLNQLAMGQPRLKLLLTSRPKRHLQSALRHSSIIHISLQQRLVDADILSYLNYRLYLSTIFTVKEQYRPHLVDMVAKRSNGLFLYAKLTMDQVEAAFHGDNIVNIDSLEKSLPMGLEETYDSMLLSQRQANGVVIPMQVMILQAVTHAARPLRLNELASLIKCKFPGLSPPSGFKTLVSTACGSLIEILEDETLQVIHHSLTEFLRGDTRKTEGTSTFPVIDSPQAHKEMATSCLQYLRSGTLLLDGERDKGDSSAVFHTPSHQTDPDELHYRRSYLGIKEKKDPFNYQEARLAYPFLSYAVENWSYHASHYDVHDEDFFLAITDFLDPARLSCLRWLVLIWLSTSRSKDTNEGFPTTLHIAAFAGLSELSTKLVEQALDPSAVDAQERTPLHWAAKNGHEKVVSFLLGQGCDPNPVDARGLRPIHLAAISNHAGTVTILLRAGVEPDTIKIKENHAGRLLGGETITKGECAILYASRGGQTEVIEAMIPFCKPAVLEQLLCQCCRYGRSDAVRAIFERSQVSPDAMFYQGTALYLACSSSSIACASALIDRGADVNKSSTWHPRRVRNGGTWSKETERWPIHALVVSWSEEKDVACLAILDLLVRAGANLNQADGHGNTPAQMAAGCLGHYGPSSLKTSALQALLAAGADPKTTRRDGATLLHTLFSKHRTVEAVQLLVKHGCDPNGKDDWGHTPLHRVLSSEGMETGKEETAAIVQCLIDNGCDPNLPNRRGKTPLLMAVEHIPEIFKLLLVKCDSQATKRQCWFSLPANRTHFKQYVDLLLDEGIDINVKRQSDGRSLYLCCLNSDEQMDFLLGKGASTDIADKFGNNVLHILASGSLHARKRMEKFIADGADPLSVNDLGNTLLHKAAYQYDTTERGVEYVKWLLSLGISPNTINKDGNTALHLSMAGVGCRSASMGREQIAFIKALRYAPDLDLTVLDKNGMAVIHLAAVESQYDMFTLMDAGANLTLTTSDGQTLLHLASRSQRANIVALVLDDGSVNIDQEDNFGRTALHYASSSRDPEIVSLLLQYGASVKGTDKDGCTVLHACAESKLEQNIRDAQCHMKEPLQGSPRKYVRLGSGSHQYSSRNPWYRPRYGDVEPGIPREFHRGIGIIAKLLLEAGVDIDAVDTEGFTALDVALHFGCTEFVTVFADNPELLVKATANLARNEDENENSHSGGDIERMRELIGAQVLLTTRRCNQSLLHPEDTAREHIRRDVHLYLNLLPVQDAADLVSELNNLHSQSISSYKLLDHLLSSQHIEILQQIPEFLKDYSTYEACKMQLELHQAAKERHHEKSSYTALQKVCKQSEANLGVVRLLVEKIGVNVNAPCAVLKQQYSRDNRDIAPGGTAMHVLAAADKYWQLEAIKYLLENGANPNALDERGQTPLHIAAKGPYWQTSGIEGLWKHKAVQLLLKSGADPNILDENKKAPIHSAATSPLILSNLLHHGADPHVGTHNPLLAVLMGQDLESLNILIDHGIDVDACFESTHSRDIHYDLTTSRKVYPLLCAAYAPTLNTAVKNSVPLLKRLIERGANLYWPLNDEETLIHFLFEYPEYEVVKQLLEEPCVSRINFNRRDQQGRTVLMAACSWRQVLPGYYHRHWENKSTGPPIQILDLGADATLVDNYGKTALHRLLDNEGLPDDVLGDFINRKEVAPTLLQKDKDGLTPLHHALHSLRPDICQLLLKKGANLVESDADGRTALHHIAAQCLKTTRSPLAGGRLSIDLPKEYILQCSQLWMQALSQGVSINAADNEGNTPLHLFLKAECGYCRHTAKETGGNCHFYFYNQLLKSDSNLDVFATNKAGETMLHVVSKRQATQGPYNKDLFKVMMSKGLDPLKEDLKGRSAIDVASACGNDDIVDMFRRK